MVSKFTLAAEGEGEPAAVRAAWEAFIDQLVADGAKIGSAPAQFVDTKDHLRERRLAAAATPTPTPPPA